nr:DUF3849 domain-containing protein [uncultured Anaerotignum sp.]
MEKASHKANAQCVEDIGKAINNHFDGFHYHTGFEEELIETYGMERVQYVVAYNIQQKLNDGRISKENKTWALQSQMNQGEDNPKLEYTIHTHSGLLDLFANSIREQELTHEAEENMKEGDADEIEETDLDMQL